VSEVDGAYIAVVSMTVTVPLTGGLIVKVVGVTVAVSTGSLNVTVSAEEIDTLSAPLVGVVALTEGGLALLIPVVSVPGELPPHARRFDPNRITSNENRRW
jgi:hypothetical protein